MDYDSRKSTFGCGKNFCEVTYIIDILAKNSADTDNAPIDKGVRQRFKLKTIDQDSIRKEVLPNLYLAVNSFNELSLSEKAFINTD